MERSVVTLSRFITEEERKHPGATGAFTGILQDFSLAAKLVHRAVSKAGLVDVLGETGAENVHGERVRKLDEYAHDVMVAAMGHGGHLCVMASEEAEEVIPIPDPYPVGDYVLLFDPLDGSSNIDANVSIGTIFSLHQRVTGDGGESGGGESGPRGGDGGESGGDGGRRGLADGSRGADRAAAEGKTRDAGTAASGRHGTPRDCLQPGHRQAAAGYVVYGSSTMLVYTTGEGVHGFTLDPSIGEFVLSHPDIRIPEPGGRIYSVNEGHWGKWDEAQRALVRHLKGEEADGGGGFNQRYVGSLVADVHRTLLYGGLFMYPGHRGNPRGKLRLLYEAAPLALVAEEAGGAATDGHRRILELEPEGLHQRTPLFLGNRAYVELAGEWLGQGEGTPAEERGDGTEG